MVSKTVKTSIGSKVKYKLIKEGYKTINGTIDVTEETSPSIPLVKPETVYTSDLEYNVDTTVQHAPLVSNSDVTLPDDEVLSQGNFLWYPYDDGKQYKCPKGTITEKDNFDRVGSVKISDGVASNFSASNYLRLPSQNFGSANSWEIKTKVASSSDVSTWQMIYQSCSGTGSVGRYGIIFAFQDGKFAMAVSSSNSGWLFDIVSTHAPLPNTTYYIKAEFDGTKYTLKYSTNDVDYTTAITYESTSKVYSSLPNSFIGIYSTSSFSQPFYGKIDLNETYIKLDDEVVWKPEISDYELNATKVGSVSVDKDWNASGFNSSNYLRLNWIPSSTSFDIFGLVTTGDSLTNNHNGYIYDETNGVALALIRSTHSKMSSYVTSSWTDGTYVMSSNTKYWIRLVSESSVLSCYIKLYENEVECPNISDMTNSFTVTIPYNISGHTIRMGVANDGEKWDGSMDVSECYIKIDGEKVWEGIKYQEYIENFDKIGSPTISDDYVISNFSDSNYLKTSIGYVEGYTYTFKITTGENISTFQDIVAWYAGFFIGTSGGICYFSSSNKIISTITKNTTYWLRVELHTNGDIISYSLDNENWSTPTKQSYTYSATDYVSIGRNPNNSSKYFRGSIDLSCCYASYNDEVVWKPIVAKSSYYQGLIENSSDYKPQGGTYKLYSYHKDNEDKLIATSSTLSVDCDYSQYIQDIVIPEFTEYQYDNDTKTWTGVTDITLTLDQDDAEFSLEEVE